MLDCVIDISAYQKLVDMHALVADGILGVIHRATQGLGYVDPYYLTNRARAATVPLLWGAYHFATGEDGQAQADRFLSKAKPDVHTLLALDFETNPTPGQSTMTLPGAVHFVEEIHKQVGRWPVLYGGGYLKDVLRTKPTKSLVDVLVNCPLWLSEYNSTADVPAPWRARGGWALWQHQDNRVVGGITEGVDASYFWGDADQLTAWWGT